MKNKLILALVVVLLVGCTPPEVKRMRHNHTIIDGMDCLYIDLRSITCDWSQKGDISHEG